VHDLDLLASFVFGLNDAVTAALVADTVWAGLESHQVGVVAAPTVRNHMATTGALDADGHATDMHLSSGLMMYWLNVDLSWAWLGISTGLDVHLGSWLRVAHWLRLWRVASHRLLLRIATHGLLLRRVLLLLRIASHWLLLLRIATHGLLLWVASHRLLLRIATHGLLLRRVLLLLRIAPHWLLLWRVATHGLLLRITAHRLLHWLLHWHSSHRCHASGLNLNSDTDISWCRCSIGLDEVHNRCWANSCNKSLAVTRLPD
jgi:hypothetical protein